MKEKIAIIILGFLVLLIAILTFPKKEENPALTVEKIFRAGIALDGNLFCPNVSNSEKEKVIESTKAGIKSVTGKRPNIQSCKEAMAISKRYQEELGIEEAVLATSLIDLKQTEEATVFLASECSLYKTNSGEDIRSGEAVFKVEAATAPPRILSIEAARKKDYTKKNLSDLKSALQEENPRCA